MTAFFDALGSFVLNNVLRNAAVLLGLIAMLGLLLQRKSLADVVKGSLMAAFGMVILTEGVSILIGTIAPINAAVQSSMGLVSDAATPPDAAFTAEYGGIVGISMFFGLLLHLLIARFTPVKTVFLTGHMLWWFPFVIVAGGGRQVALDRRFAATAQTFVFPRDFHLRRAGDVADLSGRRMVFAGAGAGRQNAVFCGD